MARRIFPLILSFVVLLSSTSTPAYAPKVEDKVAAQLMPKVGDKVWAQWKPNDWYPGKAAKACPTGFHIEFDDGDKADVAVSMIAVDSAPKKEAVKVGTRVLGLWTDKKFYPGTIAKLADGKYDVDFDDGDSLSVGLEDLRLVAVKQVAVRTAKVGDKVWAQWKPNDWYAGKAAKACPKGLHVEFDDGDKADLPVSLIAIDVAPKKESVKVGTRVLGLWTDKKFYPGTVVKQVDGKYDIAFDDGDSLSVELGDLRLLNE